MPNGTLVQVTVYHPPNGSPYPADLITYGHLQEIYERGRHVAVTGLTTPSHLLTVALDVDIRDGAMEIDQPGDVLFIPDVLVGAQYDVIAVVRRETSRLCYLRRKTRPGGPFIPY